MQPPRLQAATEYAYTSHADWLRTECHLLRRKNQALAANDRAAAQIRKPFGERAVTGEKGFAEDVAGMREQAQQQGTAQHSDVAHKLKEVGFAQLYSSSMPFQFACPHQHVGQGTLLTVPMCCGQDIVSANPEAGANRAA